MIKKFVLLKLLFYHRGSFTFVFWGKRNSREQVV